MQLRDIHYAVTVAHELSFSKAAQKLFISQPALSQCIRKLEQELETPLFIRENNAVRLTSAGELFVKDGSEIIRMSARLKQGIAHIANTREEKLRIGISPFYSKHYLPRIIPAFNRLYPSVSLDISEMHSAILEQLIMEDKVDFCMIPLPLDHKDIDYQPIYQEQILFAMPKNHVLYGRLTPALSSGMPFIDLKLVKHEPFVFLKPEQKFTSMGMRLCHEAGFTPNIIFETMNWDTVDALVANGMGMGFVPEILVGTSSQSEKPAYCRIMAENTTRSYVVAYKKGRELSAAANNFIYVAKNSFHNNEAE
ncbi:LysR family transcriptional regulator [Paenibacillus thalictri]|uniref:LysR family transcriptional regulator n=1 Tax=Paenibacillus thalictri TaxID=2527873 RepID=A0A4Q9DI95_9BACL|nr:LysR family transcriptional regulator [Paenibacillus thalictri]TBL71385.1 LysR family transcriptional regulator [Paenibacillus thalictri]